MDFKKTQQTRALPARAFWNSSMLHNNFPNTRDPSPTKHPQRQGGVSLLYQGGVIAVTANG
jgi:hypothetical protein